LHTRATDENRFSEKIEPAMSGFAIRVVVDTPVILNDLLHLDALLGKLLFERGNDPLQLPLRSIENIYCGSAAIMETGPFGAVERRVTRIKSLRERDVSSRLIQSMPSRQRSIGEMSPFRTGLRDYPAFECVKAVWFVGDGDGREVFDLMGGMRSIGAMMSAGYGRVTGRKLYNLPRASYPGILLEDRRPARAMPTKIWKELGFPNHPKAVITEQRFRPPYWEGEVELCIAPVYYDLCATFSGVKELVGL
jgi:hypothetical protein